MDAQKTKSFTSESFIGETNKCFINGTVISVELPYPPYSGNHQHYRSGSGSRLKPEVIRYRRQIGLLLAAKGICFGVSEPVSVHLLASPPDRRSRDADNLAKAVLDAVTKGGLLEDDSNKVIRDLRVTWAEPSDEGVVMVVITQAAR